MLSCHRHLVELSATRLLWLSIIIISARSSSCSNCSSQLCPQPCAAQTNCRSWWPPGDRPRHRLENVTCLFESCQCLAKFFAGVTTTRQTVCLEGELAICSGTAYNLTCPAGARLKIWYAYFGRSSDSTCPVAKESSRKRNNSTEPTGTPPPDGAVAPTAAVAQIDQRPLDACLTPVLTSAIRQCDGRQNCWLQPDELLADVSDCRLVSEPYLLMDFACLGASDGATSTEQELFFRWGLLIIGALFPTSLLALLVTVQLRKKRQDAFKMNSMHLPLTRHENPEV